MNKNAKQNRRNAKKILIIGSGPNRIGQGIEFDYGSVHAAWIAREYGFETIMVNSNPETVSTDYDIVDRLYLEPLTLEHVLNIIDVEKPDHVVTQFGGQTALNLVEELHQANVPLLGTDVASIDICENRDAFKKLVATLQLKQPNNFCIGFQENWQHRGNDLNYPVIVRPSYLLSGSSMKIIHTQEAYLNYFHALATDKKYFPVLVEEFLEQAIEVEVDGICDGEDVFIPGVMEQFEPAGVHSGDSSCCFPPHTLSQAVQHRIMEQSRKLALALKIVGLFNIQFAVKENDIFIIEMNPRSSRTAPYLSKALGISLPQIAMKCLLGDTLKEQGYVKPIEKNYFSIKVPVFPFDRLGAVELGPEMRSTGECMFIKTCSESFNVENIRHMIFVGCLQELQ